eukprot:scaffold112761_cov46-Cyclotella_meneghiniana.AAC.2
MAMQMSNPGTVIEYREKGKKIPNEVYGVIAKDKRTEDYSVIAEPYIRRKIQGQVGEYFSVICTGPMKLYGPASLPLVLVHWKNEYKFYTSKVTLNIYRRQKTYFTDANGGKFSKSPYVNNLLAEGQLWLAVAIARDAERPITNRLTARDSYSEKGKAVHAENTLLLTLIFEITSKRRVSNFEPDAVVKNIIKKQYKIDSCFRHWQEADM